MIGQNRRAIIALLFGGTTLWTAPAVAATNDFIDLQAGLGYSSNPFLRLDSNSSAFGRLSIYGQHAWESERGKTSLSAYLENTTYFNHYGSKQIFDLNAHTQQAVSETVSIFGTATFSGDFAGQRIHAGVVLRAFDAVLFEGMGVARQVVGVVENLVAGGDGEQRHASARKRGFQVARGDAEQVVRAAFAAVGRNG